MDHLYIKRNNDTVSYLTKLTNQLHDDFSVEYRHEGAPLHPDETFLKKVPVEICLGCRLIYYDNKDLQLVC
jgi:hypothetical protein